MPVPTSNQGATSQRWLVPLLASCATDGVADHLGVVSDQSVALLIRRRRSQC